VHFVTFFYISPHYTIIMPTGHPSLGGQAMSIAPSTILAEILIEIERKEQINERLCHNFKNYVYFCRGMWA
jgi:hypothetical protein